MMATAAVAATAAIQVFVSGHATQFQGLVDELVNGLLHRMNFFLGVEEAASDWILEERFPILFKRSNFIAGQGRGRLLLLLKRLPFGHQIIVLGA